ncbi:hypothetical protein M752DRAFT_284717 [Aspergillus phoenicis ATCC 13157]|uniref:Uncharacterized protein n=1 Tax=Aspergillus phoenicis ATCC 13157 TaxID=1353007 RepID=A0A370PGB3_ASPPH|nr:hypothetical protein M752DRAFT_284717 [Aspergillus phoenicis ATCC 13157]
MSEIKLKTHTITSRAQIRRPDEDWTGVIDPGARRRLQNKLNQRAQTKYRQPSSLAEASYMMAQFDQVAYEGYASGNPCLDHLLTLTKFNVLRAFMQNLALLGIPFQGIEEDTPSPFNNALQSVFARKLPPGLSPTVTQIHVPHHPWLDCFPFPQARDNLIRVADLLNDCDLCGDIMDPANGDVGMIIWGDPWLPESWEVSEFFLRKWSWVIKGCPEIILSSNVWRARRALTAQEGSEASGMAQLEPHVHRIFATSTYLQSKGFSVFV